MKWVTTLDYNKYLNGDMKDIADLIGIENLLKLINRFNKTPIYFSDKCLLTLKKEYIKSQRGKIEPRVIARLLDVSERYIYNVYEEKNGGASADQLEIF